MIAAGREGRPATFREKKAAGVRVRRPRAHGTNGSGRGSGDEDSSEGSDTESDSDDDSSGTDSDSDSGVESEKPAKRQRTTGNSSGEILPGIEQVRKQRASVGMGGPAAATIAETDPALAKEIAELKLEYRRLYGRRPMGRYQNETDWLREAIAAAGGDSQPRPSQLSVANEPQPAEATRDDEEVTESEPSAQSSAVPPSDQPSEQSDSLAEGVLQQRADATATDSSEVLEAPDVQVTARTKAADEARAGNMEESDGNATKQTE